MSGNVHKIAVLVIFAMIVMVVSAPVMAQSAGEALYAQKCKVCHGPDGAGDTMMGKKLGTHDLRSAEVQKQTDAQLNEIITKGKNKMTGFGGKISADEIKSLVAYVRELSKKK
ncbi:MAG: cytochrome c [Acidobacteriia bacterium]|nr:cytochrome c [Terriglobia bacterium]